MIYRSDFEIWLWARRHPDFEPGEAGAEAAQPETVARCRRVQKQWAPTRTTAKFRSHFGIRALLLAILLLVAGEGAAREPYHVRLTVNGSEGRVSAPNLVDLKRNLRTVAIAELIPIYTPTSALSVDIDLRGIEAAGSFAVNSTTLVVTFPDTGTTASFTGGTRDESWALFKNYVAEAGTGKELLRAYARYSPIDPLAGNPNSLTALMAEGDYAMGRLYEESGCCCGAQPVRHLFREGANFVRGFADGYDTSSATLPGRYSYSPGRSWALILDAPVTYNRNGGASSVFGSVGVGARYPLTGRWSVTPVVRMGTGVSLDLATGGLFLSAGATSAFDLKAGGGVFSLINYAGYQRSVSIWTTGINWNYRIYNFVFKNGLVWTSCEGVKWCGRVFNGSLSFTDTAFTGNRLFMMHYDEVGAAIFTSCLNRRIEWDSLTLGFGYQFGERGYRGWRFSAIYLF